MKKVSAISDLDATHSLRTKIAGIPYVVVISPEDQQLRVYKNACPHLGIQLEMLENEFLDPAREYIVCANHGALFQLEDGLCIAGPCAGQSLQSVGVKIAQGSVYLEN